MTPATTNPSELLEDGLPTGPGHKPRAPRKLPHYDAGELERAPLVAPAQSVTVGLAAAITGFSDKAILRKIEDGKWIEGVLWRRAPDRTMQTSLEGYRSGLNSHRL